MKFSDITEDEQTVQVDVGNIITPDMELIERVLKDAGHSIRIVGGAVRDVFTGEPPKDIDFATDATPDEMKEVFDKNSLHWIATGVQHGTLTVVGPKSKEPFEITTLRIDSDHDGRHAEVEFTRSWEEDSERRDLTYNALSMDFDGTVYDYHNGVADLKAGKTRFVGDPNGRITEDFLRILRMFRFAARYGHKLTPKEMMAVSRNVKGLEQISGERVWMEISKILSGNNTAMSLEEMKSTGVAQVIGIPANDVSKIHLVKKFTDNPVTILMSLTHKQEQVDHYINDWKWSTPEKKLAQFLLDNKFNDFKIEIAQDMIINGAPKDFVIELAHLRINPKIATEIENWDVPEFPIQGRDLVSMGMKPGPDMGKMLKYLKTLWVSARFAPTRDELLDVLKQHLEGTD